jgi:UDP-glucose 4-epimerase
MDKTILLTGATGFVGRSLAHKLCAKELRLLGRTDPKLSEHRFCQAEINGTVDFKSFLKDVDVVIHAAARAHVMNDTTLDPQLAYDEVNTAGTLNLARQAEASGVKRFVFISSIKVNGEATEVGQPFTSSSVVKTEDPYGISKAKAEVGLQELAAETEMEIVIIRPPLVYGPGVKANFAAIMNLAKRNLPLPLGAINNKRSLVALDNLVDLIITCTNHPKAANQTFLVSDDHDISTTDLLKMMTRAAGKKPMLVPVPISWLKLAGKMMGKQTVIDRLRGNLQLNINHTKHTLGWKPPITLEEGIRRCFIKEEQS